MGKGRQRLVELACTWSHKSRKPSTNSDQKENKSDIDKPLIAYYMALGCLVVSWTRPLPSPALDVLYLLHAGDANTSNAGEGSGLVHKISYLDG